MMYCTDFRTCFNITTAFRTCQYFFVLFSEFNLEVDIMYERYCEIRDKLGLKDAVVAKETGISKSTFSEWKSGRSKPKTDKLQKIADYFNVSLEYFTTGTEPKNKSKEELTVRDQRDIKEILSSTEELLKQPGLMFEGQPASPESIDSILSAMQIGMEMAKKRNKEKYTPNKYIKD